jgi:hypothetical protein
VVLQWPDQLSFMFTSVNFFNPRLANAVLLACTKTMLILLLENKNANTVFFISYCYKE